MNRKVDCNLTRLGTNINHKLESFYHWNTLNFSIMPIFVSQSEVYYKVDRLLTDLTAQQRNSNKTTLYMRKRSGIDWHNQNQSSFKFEDLFITKIATKYAFISNWSTNRFWKVPKVLGSILNNFCCTNLYFYFLALWAVL